MSAQGTNTKQVWIYTSTDGGQTWINQIFPLSPTSPFSSDPVVSFSDDGQCYVTALPYGGGGGDGVQVARSLDGGITFSPGVHLPGTNGNSDKEWTWVDNNPSSPFYHRIYTAWMNFSPGFRVDYSTDRGLTWTLAPLSQSAFQFPMPIVYPDGQVQTIFAFSTTFSQIRSTDGGATWTTAATIVNYSQANCPPDNAGCGIWKLNSIPVIAVNPLDGKSVVVWADGSDGTAKIKYSLGSSDGTVWSASQILAPPGVGGTYQVEPGLQPTRTASSTQYGTMIALIPIPAYSISTTASLRTTVKHGARPEPSPLPRRISASAYPLPTLWPQATISTWPHRQVTCMVSGPTEPRRRPRHDP